jgi:hypothetical protein
VGLWLLSASLHPGLGLAAEVVCVAPDAGILALDRELSGNHVDLVTQLADPLKTMLSVREELRELTSQQQKGTLFTFHPESRLHPRGGAREPGGGR